MRRDESVIQGPRRPRLRQRPVLVLGALALLVVAGGTFICAGLAADYRRDAEQQLRAVADFKLQRFTAWIRERRGDVDVLGRGASFSRGFATWLSHGMPSVTGGDLRQRLDTMRRAYGYSSVLIVSPYGEPLLSAGDLHVLSNGELRRVSEVAASMEPQAGEFDLNYAGTERPGFEVMGPVSVVENDEARVLAVAIARVDGPELAALVHEWPGTGSYVNVDLVRVQSDQLESLNFSTPAGTRGAATAGELSRAELMRALAGRADLIRGTDVAGRPVVAAIRELRASNWRIVATLPAGEVYAAATRLGRTVALTAALSVLVGAAAMLAFWHSNRRRMLARIAAVRREQDALARHFDYLARYAHDVMVLTDTAGHVVEVNDRSESMFGYSRAEVLGMNVSNVIAAPARGAFVQQLARMGPDGCVFETTGRTKNGGRVALEVSARTMDVDGASYVQGIVRDVTERKQLERELIDAINREQTRLGHELHDGLGQELTGLALLLGALATRSRQGQLANAEEIAHIASLASRCIETCRTVARGLSPGSDAQGGLTQALGDLARRQGRMHGPAVGFEAIEDAPLALPPSAIDHLYRIAQEALANALKHAEARSVNMTLDVQPDHVRLEIVDDGKGCELGARRFAGLGIRTMRYRAAMVGARIDFERAERGGLAVICECPQPDAQHLGTAANEATSKVRAA
jgi:PAS domain S-box-containing protein